MHDKKERGQDKKNVDEESSDVKYEKGDCPYEYKHQGKAEKDGTHPHLRILGQHEPHQIQIPTYPHGERRGCCTVSQRFRLRKSEELRRISVIRLVSVT